MPIKWHKTTIIINQPCFKHRFLHLFLLRTDFVWTPPVPQCLQLCPGHRAMGATGSQATQQGRQLIDLPELSRVILGKTMSCHMCIDMHCIHIHPTYIHMNMYVYIYIYMNYILYYTCMHILSYIHILYVSSLEITCYLLYIHLKRCHISFLWYCFFDYKRLACHDPIPAASLVIVVSVAVFIIGCHRWRSNESNGWLGNTLW